SVGENAERNVEGENRAVRGRRCELVRGGRAGGDKKDQDERKSVRANRALAMIDLKAEISEAKKPAEERHRAVQVVIWDGMQLAGTFKQGEVVGHKSGGQQERSSPAGDFLAGLQEREIQAQAQAVGECGQNNVEMGHFW